MKATIRGVPVEGTPQEIAELIRHFDGDGPQTPAVVPYTPIRPNSDGTAVIGTPPWERGGFFTTSGGNYEVWLNGTH